MQIVIFRTPYWPIPKEGPISIRGYDKIDLQSCGKLVGHGSEIKSGSVWQSCEGLESD